ncbi:MAG: peptidoglycan bridge formation glycyltransferase FemA/FemB family protein [Anaerolineaceae bacterium]|nr:peptidoglycan bridge formation glycyltransferase FemA/FemB family protein [Anaerolineaceae bacterium]
MSIQSASQWNEFLKSYPGAHILQSSEWGHLKSHFGWQPVRIVVGQSGAQILFRRLPGGLSLAYIPKGPIGQNWDSLWPEVDRLCRSKRAIFLKLEPDAWDPLESDFISQLHGFLPETRPIQPRRTIIIDLNGPEETWLERMKQKTRYNIRLAERKGILVRPVKDMRVFSQMMQTTGVRDGFGVHSLDYYQCAYDQFAAEGKCELLQAEYEGLPLAGLMVFAQGKRAWYFYGASSDEERNRMPTYLLQFEAMRWAARKGCTEYDLWGIPDTDEEQLEANFNNRSDGLWGVYRFKRGFGGNIMQAAASYERVYTPLLYKFYRWWSEKRKKEIE